ncbi:MAG: dTMP kinase [Xanthobacteraceae bacterium]|nr:dTMP kinase [Xanthobacteraceae bacterium]QYK46397.1 MAG: dTMP kinase [Xanthobacteraceae bacterium]
MRGKFITLEGGEGSGKSTQATRLAERLKLRGIDVVTTREPGGSAGAEAIRILLLNGVAKPLGPTAETMLFAAARDDHIQSTILPALERGAWVICDRFLDSTRVYQGVLGQVDPKVIRALERVTVGDVLPDLTFVLDVPVEVGAARVKGRSGQQDRFEAEDLEFHLQIREGFRALAQNEKERCVLVDASQSPDVVAVRIWMTVVDRLLKGRAPAIAPRAAG